MFLLVIFLNFMLEEIFLIKMFTFVNESQTRMGRIKNKLIFKFFECELNVNERFPPT